MKESDLSLLREFQEMIQSLCEKDRVIMKYSIEHSIGFDLCIEFKGRLWHLNRQTMSLLDDESDKSWFVNKSIDRLEILSPK